MPWGAIAAIGSTIVGGFLADKGDGGKSETSSAFDRTNVYDEAATEKVTDIGETVQQWGEEQWDLYNDFVKDYEIEAVQSNRELLPFISEYAKTSFDELEKTGRDFQQMAREGIDTSARMDQAEAEVVGAFEKVPQDLKLRAASHGIDPSSRRFENTLSRMGIDEAKAISGARTSAKERGEAEQFSRLGLATGKEPGVGMANTPDVAGRSAGYMGLAQGSYQPLANRVLEVSQRGAGAREDKSNVFDYAGDVAANVGGYIAGNTDWSSGQWDSGDKSTPEPSAAEKAGKAAGSDYDWGGNQVY